MKSDTGEFYKKKIVELFNFHLHWACLKTTLHENLPAFLRVKGKVVPVLKTIQHYAMKRYVGVEE
jgi:hypothetical protein